MKIQRRGFTLAEVLITLTTIGVVAAILLPAVKNLIPNQNAVMFRKAFSLASSAVSDLVNDDGNYPSSATATANGSTIQILLANRNVGTTPIPSGACKFCYLFSKEFNLTGTTVADGYSMASTQYGTFTTVDGMRWRITDNQPTTDSIIGYPAYEVFIIYVDVNGANKGPNCYYGYDPFNAFAACTTPSGAKQDIFSLGVTYDGSIQVADGSEYLKNPTKFN